MLANYLKTIKYMWIIPSLLIGFVSYEMNEDAVEGVVEAVANFYIGANLQ